VATVSAAPAVSTAETPEPVAVRSGKAEEPIPDPITHPCVVKSVQFDIAFRDGDKTCQRDSDCECIPARVGDKHACSGVTSKKTIAKLRTLQQEFTKLGCTDTRKCAQTVCQPRCEGGQCQ